MTTIKMNDGRTQYDTKENYTLIRNQIEQKIMLDEKMIEITDAHEGKVLLNIDSIFSVKESRD